MIIIVGRGYIGTNLFRCLHDYGRDVVTIGRDDSFDLLNDLTPKDVVINCAGAGMKPVKPSSAAYLAENVLLPIKLAKFTALKNIRMIHLGSYFEMFQHDIYAKSKALTSEMLKRKPNVSIVYAYNVYGKIEYPHRFYAAIKHAILTDTTFTLTTPGACRSLVHISHVVSALNEIIDKSAATYHLTDGNYTSMSSIVQDVKSIFPNFKCVIKDTPPYTHECFSPEKPYFEKLDLLNDIRKDVENDQERARNVMEQAS